jgi:flagellar protein FliO/FliZ
MEFIILSADGSDAGSLLSLFGSFFHILLIFALIILVCWFALRMTGRVRGRGGTSKNLHLVETILVGSQNMVQLVRAGDKYLVIGVTRERVTLLGEVDAEQIRELDPPQIGTPFKQILERFTNKNGNGDGDETPLE